MPTTNKPSQAVIPKVWQDAQAKQRNQKLEIETLKIKKRTVWLL